MTPTDEQVICATKAWLTALRREFATRNPGEPYPYPDWAELPIAGRGVLMRSIKAALIAADPAAMAQARLRATEDESQQ